MQARAAWRWARNFYPRPPRGGRRPEQHYHFALEKFLSTPSARRATLSVLCSHFGCADFYPRPPRGGRPCVRLIRRRAKIFLSTPSARRATYNGSMFTKSFEISIHALREEGDTQQHRTWSIFSNFYPRPPRGGRLVMRIIAAWSMLFLSTPSARRATLWRSAASYLLSISIHALREEGDTWAFFAIAVAVFISIHALREEGDRNSCRN